MDLCSAFPMARAGGHRTVHALLRRLAQASDTDCLCVFPRRGQGSQLPGYDPGLADFEALGIRSVTCETDRWVFDCGYPLWAMRHLEAEHVAQVMDECIARFSPDVVWSNSYRSLPVLRAAVERNLNAFWYVQDARPHATDLREAADLGVRMAAVSRFIAHRVQRYAAEDCRTIYPLIDEREYLVPAGAREPGSARFVTLINPRPVKGFDIFLGIPALLPQVAFLVVEAWPLGDELSNVHRALAAMPNVRFLRQQADAREIYRQTRLLLVPSVVEEGGPRVIREAQLNGIPVLGSPRGGVPEMIGNGGEIIDDYENPQAWANTIRAILSDASRYESLCRSALENAGREALSSEWIVRNFREVCRQPLSAPVCVE